MTSSRLIEIRPFAELLRFEVQNRDISLSRKDILPRTAHNVDPLLVQRGRACALPLVEGSYARFAHFARIYQVAVLVNA